MVIFISLLLDRVARLSFLQVPGVWREITEQATPASM
jgi:hypothetical protein